MSTAQEVTSTAQIGMSAAKIIEATALKEIEAQIFHHSSCQEGLIPRVARSDPPECGGQTADTNQSTIAINHTNQRATLELKR